MSVTVRRRGAVAIVTLDNPPVNAIGQALRAALLDAIERLESEAGLERVVLNGANAIFAAGGDAREFDAPPVEPHLPDIVARIEASAIPWIGAASGAALGGGLELLLGCRWRIAAPAARIGLPETTLGVVPGAGGTQRLPRLIGVEQALELIASGRAISAREALALGLIDALAEDPLAAALISDLAPMLARPPLSQAPDPEPAPEAAETARRTAGRRRRGQDAPPRAIELVETAAVRPFASGLAAERAAFLELRQSPQSRALRHVFFAERAARAPDWLEGVEPAPLDCAVVVGGGTMGAGIAYALASAGIDATIVERDAEGAARAEAGLDRLVAGAVARGLLSEGQSRERRAALRVVEGYGALPPARLAIEAAFEDLDVKRAVFERLEAALPDDAVLATNTSYLDVNELADTLSAPERVLGLHFFSPAHIMKLLEIVRGEASSVRALATGFALAKRLRKIPVLAGVCDGFIGNRILARYREAADTLLMDGAAPWEIDAAMVEFGYAMGPYQAQDLSGLDIAYANRKRQAATRDPQRRYIPIADRMVEEGRFGKKAGVGWYRYPGGGGGGAVEDPLIEDLIREEAHFAKVARRDFTADEIRARLLAAMVNEAAATLDEGIAASAADIDVVLVHGYGFPRWRGGLMHYADAVGLDAILADLKRFAGEDPLVWAPSPLLVRLAEQGRGFADRRREGATRR